MHCKYLAKDGKCTGKYAGYACIKGQCSLVKESKKCEYHEDTGDYCRRLARFGCVGKDNCHTVANYLEAVSEEESS